MYRFLRSQIINIKTLCEESLKNQQDVVNPLLTFSDWGLFTRLRNCSSINEIDLVSLTAFIDLVNLFSNQLLQKRLNNTFTNLNFPINRDLFTYNILMQVLEVNTLFSCSYKLADTIDKLQTHIQKGLYIRALEKLVMLQTQNYVTGSFFMPHFMDFRGRIYSSSPLHPMHNKITRFCIRFPSNKG